MSKMTIVQLGVIVFAFYLSSQVLSQSTMGTAAQGTTAQGTTANVTSTKADANTTMATDVYSSSTNSTKGGSAMLQVDRLSFLVPVIVSASFLHRNC